MNTSSPASSRSFRLPWPSGLFNNDYFRYDFGFHALRPFLFSRRARRCGSRVLPLEFPHLLFSHLLAQDRRPTMPALRHVPPAVGPSGPRPAYSALHSTCTSALLAPADRAKSSTAASSASRLKPHVYSKSSCPWQPRPSRTVAVFSKPALQRPASVFLLQQQRQQKQQQDLLQ